MVKPPKDAPIERCSKNGLRYIFNVKRLWDRAKAGEFTMHLEGTDRPFSEDEVARIRNAIPGTRSQQVIYRDSEGYDVAIVHQFLRPDGLLAGFERPDPTHLYVDGIHYRRMKNEPSYDKEPSSD